MSNQHHQLDTPSQTISRTVSGSLLEAVKEFAPSATQVEPVGGRHHLAAVTTETGRFVVRAWPRESTLSRVVANHQLHNAASLMGSLVRTPGGKDIVSIAAQHFDARAWIPGEPPARERTVIAPDGRAVHLPIDVGPNLTGAIAAGIAKLHLQTGELAERPSTTVGGLPVFAKAVNAAWRAQQDLLSPIAGTVPHIQRWFKATDQLVPAARNAVLDIDFIPGPAVITHSDLWPAHTLVARADSNVALTGFAGLIDPVAGSAILDVAQLITRFHGWSAVRAEETLAAYLAVRMLTPDERRLLPVIAALDLSAAAGRLLTYAYAEETTNDVRGVDAIRSAAAHLVHSIEAILPIVLRYDKPFEKNARAWVHKPRPAGAKPIGKPGSKPADPNARPKGRIPRKGE